MALLVVIIPKDKDRDKTLDGSGVALVAITLVPTIKTGVDQEIVHNPPDHVFLPKMITPWIHPLLSVKPQMIKNMRSTARWANALNVESKATLSVTAPIKRHVLVQLAPFKLKMTTNRLSLTLSLQLCPSLHKWHIYLRKTVAPSWTKCAPLEKIWIFRLP